MVFRWGEKVFKQRNSGILYHSYGPFGDGLGVWMSSHEFQLCTAKMGDSYCMGNSYFEILAVQDVQGKSYRYAADGTISKFGVNFPAKNCSKKEDHEKPAREWNVVDLYCVGRNSVHIVNGVVNMVNSNSGRIEKDGSVLPLSKKGEFKFSRRAESFSSAVLRWKGLKRFHRNSNREKGKFH